MFDLSAHGSVAVLRMRHGKANAMDLEFCEALTAQLDACQSGEAAALVLTGEGRMFSAGVDLLRVLDGGAAYVRVFLPAMINAFDALFSFPKPLVAAINGHAIAGGCVMAAAADRRIMARQSGRIGVPELIVGVPFPAVPFEIMRYASAPAYFQALVLGGATLPAESALEQGLVDAIVEPDALLDRAIGAANELAAIPSSVFAFTKHQLRGPALARMRDGASRTGATVQQMWESPETLTAIREYVARTFAKP